jgi:hypothetical protein
MDIVKNTGSYLLEKLLITNTSTRIKVQFVVDESQRDVDTSFALYQGMLKASANKSGLLVQGLPDLTFDPSVFKPTKAVQPLCSDPLLTDSSVARVSNDIQQRLQTVPPPEPNLHETLLLLQKLGGIGSFGDLTLVNSSSVERGGSGDEFQLHGTTLEGSINVVKLFAQMAFYSRAGGIDPPFLPNATVKEVYQLLEWLVWERSVRDVDNVQAAVNGSVMAQAILQVLRTGHYNVQGSSDNGQVDGDQEKYDASVTIFVGHDGDIDSLATALGLRWKLQPPYRSGEDGLGDYVDTPPGSTMHFEYDLETGEVGLSYLYPVYITEAVTSAAGMALNASGILERTPMVFVPRHDTTMDGDVTIRESDDGKATVISAAGLDILGQRLLSTIEKFPQASECYYAVVNRSQTLVLSTDTTQYSKLGLANNPSIFFGMLVSSLLVACFLGCCLLSCRRQREKTIIYNEVTKGAEVV